MAALDVPKNRLPIKQPSLNVVMTTAELGAATDIVAAIYKGCPNKRDYNKLVRSITEVITQLLSIRGKKLTKGATLISISHSIQLGTQEVKYVFEFGFDADAVAEAFT